MDQRGIFLSSGVNLQLVAWVTKFRGTSKVRGCCLFQDNPEKDNTCYCFTKVIPLKWHPPCTNATRNLLVPFAS